MPPFLDRLSKLDACPEACDWVGSRSLEDAWAECPRGDWMIWGAMRMAGRPGWSSAQEVVEVLCDIVEPALRHVPAGEFLPAEALAVVRRWCAGDATMAEVDSSGAAADAAAAAYTEATAAVVSASFAAKAAAAVADAAKAAAVAARNAAAAAYAAEAAEAADAADSDITLQGQADLIRDRLTIGEALWITKVKFLT